MTSDLMPLFKDLQHEASCQELLCTNFAEQSTAHNNVRQQQFFKQLKLNVRALVVKKE